MYFLIITAIKEQDQDQQAAVQYLGSRHPFYFFNSEFGTNQTNPIVSLSFILL
jgi:hypothetical protein